MGRHKNYVGRFSDLLYCRGIVQQSQGVAGNLDMVRSGIAAIIIGIGFGIPAVVYKTDLPQWIKIIIHMGIGCLIMTGASMLGGWLPVDKGLPTMLKMLTVQLAAAFAIWSYYYISARIESKKINRKIRELQQDK